MGAEKPTRPAQSQSQARVLYLTLYNLTFAALWLAVLYRVLGAAPGGKGKVFDATEGLARGVQTLTLIEVLHAAVGIVKSPVGTTALQVVTRVIQVWMVWWSFPESTRDSAAYGALVSAWALADSVRYLYLAMNLHGLAPGALVWLRYTMFYALYPVGIGAEWWLLYRAIEPSAGISPVIPPIFYFCLALYIPGSYTMYTYMIKQRRKTLGSKQKSK
ncbi:PTPLA-domain-containing protein [Corynespora cassiicola Philippines]|uniref:Very-long-chain (3R)-3-hydroxyacyl-CoA dehydratase n=1 Tax=Corynespora cassiicola Philippines TaxID=1448308 RepID=A0A2T2P850_CORCC|nr:PTPLA-domain-containing protein [Corynespora cassiicola Philippines]